MIVEVQIENAQFPNFLDQLEELFNCDSQEMIQSVKEHDFRTVVKILVEDEMESRWVIDIAMKLN